MQALWDHYSREELPFKDFSTQDAYLSYAKNWILPRWGSVLLQRVKTVEVERWLREATVSNGTRAKIKCVHVSSVLTCRPLGIRPGESDLIGNTRGHGRQARAEYRRSRECKKTAGANCFIPGATQTGTLSA